VFFSRRRFLSFSLGTGLLTGTGFLFKKLFWSPSTTTPEFQTLAAYLDILIPADEAPSATQLGVTEHLIAEAANDSGYQRLISKGCTWLDAQAQQQGAAHFAALSEAQRERIVSLAAAGEGGLLAVMFFDRIRESAFSHYYAHPQSWRALDYDGPPQPRGFMNYTQAPSRRSS